MGATQDPNHRAGDPIEPAAAGRQQLGPKSSGGKIVLGGLLGNVTRRASGRDDRDPRLKSSEPGSLDDESAAKGIEGAAEPARDGRSAPAAAYYDDMFFTVRSWGFRMTGGESHWLMTRTNADHFLR
jgi:hypothetical protein